MQSFTTQLNQAREIALSRLVDIAQNSEDEKEVRLAAAAILKIEPDPESPPAAQPVSPPARPAPAAAPQPSQEPTPKDVSRLVAALSRSITAGAAPPLTAMPKSPYTGPP